MLTPAYNLTATERVLPRLALDFTTGVLDSRVTVTRALNTATRVNSSGYIEVVNANLPRFDYAPITFTPRGLLIEELRANLLLQSEALTSPWTIDGGGSLNATPTAAPDNANTAKKLQENTANTYFRAYQSVTLTNGVVYTGSVFAKPSGRDWLYLYFNGGVSTAYVNVATKTVGTTTGSPTITFSDYANGFTRVNMTFTNTTVGGQNVQAWLAQADNVRTYQGDGSSGMYLWGFGLEAGAFATSYIPTTTTSLTRNADAVDMTGTNFSSWYNATEGTLFAEASTFSNAATDKFVANINNNGFPNRILMNFSSLNNFSASVVSNSVSQVSGTNGTAATLNTPIKMCFATKLDNFAWAQSGVAPSTDTLGNMPVTVDRLWIGGANTTAFLNGHMRQIKFWPQRLTNAEVQAFSK